MKTLLSLTLFSGFLLASTGCVDTAVYSRRPHDRRGYYDDRRDTTYYETRPVYRDDGYYGRRGHRVYDAPRAPHSEVRVSF